MWGEVVKSASVWGKSVVRSVPVNKMETQTAIARTYYNGLYRHGVDDKRRVQIPAKWRPEESGVEFTMIVWPKADQGTCLRVLPPEEIAQLMIELDAMPSSDPKKVVLKRVIGSRSVQVTLDKAGRICLPDEMAKEAGISDEVMLVGLLDRFEVWSPTRYQKVEIADDVVAHEAFKLME